jgi:hypothetical protein
MGVVIEKCVYIPGVQTQFNPLMCMSVDSIQVPPLNRVVPWEWN